jgi:outer membrane lipoprotein-sorting protein
MMMTRGRWILLVVMATSLTAAGTLTYKKWPQILTKFRRTPATNSPQRDQLSSVPPFSTKEPEIYQATRIVTNVEKTGADGNSTATTRIEKLEIARDGQNRREEITPGTFYLESSNGRFLLFPEQKIYADLNATSETENNFELGELTDSSPERLLHESSSASSYQNLGPDVIDGRKTTKYRVLGDEGETGGNESTILIWVDDELSMPIKSEMTSGTTVVTIALTNIRRAVDSQVFELPKDYKRVEVADFWTESRQRRSVADKAEGKSN